MKKRFFLIVSLLSVLAISVLSITSEELQSQAENVQIIFDPIFGHNHNGTNSAKLAANSVNTTQLVDNSVTNSKISGPISVSKGGTGLSSLGSANQVLKVNSAGTALEYATSSSGGGQSGDAVYALSTTIGDYFQPSSATASSSSGSNVTLTEVYNQITASGSASNLMASGGDGQRAGMKIESGSAAIGAYIQDISAVLKKTGSPSGNITFTVRNGADTIIQSVTLATSSITSSYATYTVAFPFPVQLASGYRVMIEYAGGDASNYVTVRGGGGSAPSGFTYTIYAGSYSGGSNALYAMQFDPGGGTGVSTFGASYAVDGNTTTLWKSNSEANPNIYVDLGSAREIVGIAVNLDRTFTTISSLKLRASTDTTFTDSENIAYVNVSDFTDDTWRFLANNLLPENKRYVQIYANETGVLAINEITAKYGVSDLNKILNHFHKKRTVTSVDSFIDSN